MTERKRILIFYEPRPLYEAYAFLCDCNMHFSANTYMNNMILRNPDRRKEFTRYLELITILSKRLRSAIPDERGAMHDLFDVLSPNEKKTSKDDTEPHSSLFEVMVPEQCELSLEPDEFFERLHAREAELPLTIMKAIAPPDTEIDINDSKAVFKIINESNTYRNAKYLLTDAVINPRKYVTLLEEMFTSVIKEFEACKPVWEEMIAPYRESYSKFSTGAELMRVKFDATFSDADDPSVYPSVMGYRQSMYGVFEYDPKRAVSYVGVLYDRFAVSTAEDVSTVSFVSCAMNVLGDQTRFSIFNRLSEGRAYGRELSKELGLSPGTISDHLSVLTGIGLVSTKMEGKKIYYSINRPKVRRFLEMQNALFLRGESDDEDADEPEND